LRADSGREVRRPGRNAGLGGLGLGRGARGAAPTGAMMAGQGAGAGLAERSALRVERSKELVLHAPDDRAEPHQLLSTIGREADGVTAAVARIPASVRSAPLLEGVEQPYELAAVEPELLASSLGLASPSPRSASTL